MACFTPLKAYRAEGGGVAFSSREGYVDRPLELACGQCIGCRMERSRQWALRCVHEASLHEKNCFVTLTYRPEDVPVDGSVDVRHWQKFAKRLRKRVGPFRFLHVGEYGEENFRPHYHACIFGQDFAEDRRVFSRRGSNETFTSETLESTWGFGFTTLGRLTWQSAAYVARYCMKKATGVDVGDRLRRIDLETGEEYYVKPEYNTMSRRPGLAADWYRRFKADVFPDDYVVHNGEKLRVPAFYDRILEKEDPALLVELKRKRKDAAFARRADCSVERLAVREEVMEARLSRLGREV